MLIIVLPSVILLSVILISVKPQNVFQLADNLPSGSRLRVVIQLNVEAPMILT
jgi:hypothetical protein